MKYLDNSISNLILVQVYAARCIFVALCEILNYVRVISVTCVHHEGSEMPESQAECRDTFPRKIRKES